MKTLRTETANGVRHLVLCRAAEYNTITPALRDELAAAIDAADDDRDVHVILLRAEGRAFCAGYGLDWSTAAEAQQVVYDDANNLTDEPGNKLTGASKMDLEATNRGRKRATLRHGTQRNSKPSPPPARSEPRTQPTPLPGSRVA